MKRVFFQLALILSVLGCASQPTPRQLATAASSALVCIYGYQVHSPGAYAWHSGMTITELIQAAGGLSEFAGNSRFNVNHPDGTQNSYGHARVFRGEPVELIPGDRVYVYSPFL